MAFMAQFYPHDAHVKTHRAFVEDQKRRMKSIYRIQKFKRHHENMLALQEHIRQRIVLRKILRRVVSALCIRLAIQKRQKFKKIFGRCVATWRIRLGLRKAIERRAMAKARLLRFVLNWKAKKDAAFAAKAAAAALALSMKKSKKSKDNKKKSSK